MRLTDTKLRSVVVGGYLPITSVQEMAAELLALREVERAIGEVMTLTAHWTKERVTISIPREMIDALTAALTSVPR